MTEYQKLPDDWEGDWEALKTAEGWEKQAKELEALGIKRSGHIGVSCPTCWSCKACLCGFEPTHQEVLTALGFECEEVWYAADLVPV